MSYLGLNNLPQFNPTNTPWAQGVGMYQNLQQFPLQQQQKQLANQQQQIANQYAPQVNQSNIALAQAQASFAQQQANETAIKAKYPLMYSSNPILAIIGSKHYMAENPGSPIPAGAQAAQQQGQAAAQSGNNQTMGAGNQVQPQSMPQVPQVNGIDPRIMAAQMAQGGVTGNSMGKNGMVGQNSPGMGSLAGRFGLAPQMQNPSPQPPMNPGMAPTPAMQQPQMQQSPNQDSQASGVDANGFPSDQQLMNIAGAQLYPSLTGAAGDALSMQKLGLIAGTNSDTYKNADAQYQANIQKLTNQGAPNLGKLQALYQKQISNNQTDEALQTAAQIQKLTGTTQDINRAVYGDAIRKTLNNIPVVALQHYAGSQGVLHLAQDKIANLFGKAPPIYNTYEAFQNSVVPLLKGQMTKFYGGSVQPEAQNELDSMVSPGGWQSNPNIVQQSLQKLQDIFNTEAETFTNAANKGVGPFTNAQIPGLANSPGSSSVAAPANSQASTQPQQPTITMANVADYANRKKMSQQQVLSLMKQKGWQVNG